MTLDKINLLIPMAGEGSRFKKAGYVNSKPFIMINNEPMIVKVINNFSKVHNLIESLILICRTENLKTLKDIIDDFFPLLTERVKYITVDKLTEGAACTTLFAYEHINNSLPLIIANSDQIVGWDELDFLTKSQEYDGSILVFRDSDKNPKWSFVKLDDEGFVYQTFEKKPVSDLASVGIYYFRHGNYFINASVRMMIENDRTNNEFYICPVYNYLIKNNLKISIFEINKEDMHGLGTPEDLEAYLEIC